ncbi:5-oxoprolinase subunit PxpB [Hyunsoonleella sp. 2307UL5-6]|uniref:5-oxoprolinase subunit PxpB n=1 Tax=Hyunsoonleella sp. 2307UL5-6 TaxID=3384768 RepID=UPI0039BC8FED
MAFDLKYKYYGANGILVEWPQRIDESILKDILAFKSKLKNNKAVGTKNLHHGYASLLITYQNSNFNFSSEVNILKQVYNTSDISKKDKSVMWKIPVCYDVSFGIDLEQISKEKQISIQDIVTLHSKPTYTIFFIGFLPGFLYLGGLDKVLFTPRKATPRLAIEKGALGIGGAQTGIYPTSSPGGWHIIGNCPINFFDISKPKPCFARAGDSLKFYPISLKEFHNIKTLVNAGVYQIESEVLND